MIKISPRIVKIKLIDCGCGRSVWFIKIAVNMLVIGVDKMSTEVTTVAGANLRAIVALMDRSAPLERRCGESAG